MRHEFNMSSVYSLILCSDVPAVSRCSSAGKAEEAVGALLSLWSDLLEQLLSLFSRARLSHRHASVS